jgi:hypothetical protein
MYRVNALILPAIVNRKSAIPLDALLKTLLPWTSF